MSLERRRRTGLVIALAALFVLLLGLVIRAAEDFGGWDFSGWDFGFDFGTEEETAGEAAVEELPPPAPGVPGGYRLGASKGKLELYVEDKSGHIAVRDLRSGFVWLSKPSIDIDSLAVSGLWKDHMKSTLVLQYTDAKRTRIRTTDTEREMPEVKMENITDGVRFTYDMSSLGITIPLEYRLLEGNRLEVKIPEKGLKESEDALITSIEVLPFLGAQGDDANGYLFYPDGSGAIAYFKKVHPRYDQGFSGFVYGPNVYQWDMTAQTAKMIHFPVFGLKVDNSAMVAIVDKGAYDLRINCSPSGYMVPLNRGSAEFLYRRTFNTVLRRGVFVETVDKRRITGDRVVLYTFLHGKDANYSGMAREYRSYLLKNGLLTTAISKEDPLPLELRIFNGIMLQTLLGGRMITVTTFDQVKTIVKAVIDRGVPAVNVTLVGWGARGYNGNYPRRLPPDKAFGGERGLRDLVNWAKAQPAKINIYLEDDYVMAYQWRRGFSPRADIIREPNKLPHNSGGQFILKPEVALNKFAKRDLPIIADYGVSGVEFRQFGRFLMSDGSTGSPPGREPNANWNLKILEFARKQGLMAGIQDGNIWTLKYAGRISNIPMRGSGYFFEDESVPFFQLVVHGHVAYNGETANMRYDRVEQFLRQVEFGAAPIYEVVHDDPAKLWRTGYNRLYNGRYTRWIDEMVAEYKRMADNLGRTWGQEMISHEKLADGVYKTTYADGTEVYVNYNKTPYKVGGLTVGAGNFAVRVGKK